MQRLAVLAVPLLIALLAGCGSSGSDSSSTAATTSGSADAGSGGATQTSAATAVKTASVAKVGTVLVDSSGRAVYLYTPDNGTTSTCYGGCAAAWPPLTTGAKAQASGGAMSSQLGTTKRRDGTVQVTYAGHPLYYFAGDRGAGVASGQGDDGVWWVVTANGKADKQGASGTSDDEGDADSGSSSDSSSAGGY